MYPLFRMWLIALLLLTPAVHNATYALSAPPAIQQYTSVKIKTLRLNSIVSYENAAQLDNIGGDFADFYRLQQGAHQLSFVYEQPGRLRYDATVLGTQISYIIDGNLRETDVPLLHVHKIENITGAPGKKNTLLDFGVVPPEQLDDYQATYLRTQSGLLCFQLLSKLKTEPFKDIVWINPKTHITAQRYHYDRNGKLVARYLYKDAVLIAPGIYFPTRVEVYSPQNKLAGVTLYKNIQVNVPLSHSTFTL